MATTTKKKTDSDIPYIAVGCGVFTLGLIAVDIWVAKWSIMEPWVAILVGMLHAALIFTWVKVFTLVEDPNKDYWRKWAIGFAIAALLVIMFHHAGWVESV